MEHSNIQRYCTLHDAVMKRLQDNEITVEMAREVNNLAFTKYIIESADIDDGEKSIVKKAIDVIKEFFKKIHDMFSDAIKKLRGKVAEAYTTEQFRQALNKFQDNVEQAAEKGVKNFKFFDVEKLWSCFTDETQEYKKILMSFNQYNIIDRNIHEIEELPERVEKIHQKYEEKMIDIINNKKTYSIRDAKYVYQALEGLRDGKNIYGYTDALDEFDKTLSDVEKLVIEAMDGTLAKQVSHIKRTTSKVSQFLHKHAGKCVLAITTAIMAVPFVAAAYNTLT